MNHLAHFHLASIAGQENTQGLILGALQADYTKGPLSQTIDADLAQGILLHRQIDGFTDQHPALLKLRQAFSRPLRRYAGVLTDLSFDHFLAHNWALYDDRDLTEFCHGIYQILAGDNQRLCPDTRKMAERLNQYQVLTRYRKWSTIAISAQWVGQRFSRGNPFDDVSVELDALYPQIEQSFLSFYPELMQRFRIDIKL